MSDFNQVMLVVAALSNPMEIVEPKAVNWCTPGYTVMMPEGREGMVSSVDGDICRVIADGEAYATLIPHFIIEPVYPQPFAPRAYR